MKIISILESFDVIEASDLVRPLTLLRSGQSDYLPETGMNGLPVNRLKWLPVEAYCPAFIGKTVGQYRDAVKHLSDAEFVRGPIPDSHKVKFTKSEQGSFDHLKSLLKAKK